MRFLLLTVALLTASSALAQAPVQTAALAAPSTPSVDNFGFRVALGPDHAYVSSTRPTPSETNFSFAFARDGGTGAWTSRTDLAAGTEDYFGAGIDATATHVVIGAPTQLAAGAAYVFARTGSTWSAPARLTAPGGGSFWDSFGSAVAISGDRLAVSAYGQVTSAVYLFDRTPGTNEWVLAGSVTGRPNVTSNEFGRSLALDGDVLVVGAPGEAQSGASGREGAVYIYRRNASTGAWVLDYDLAADSRWTDNASFPGRVGEAVALADGRVFVGQPQFVTGTVTAGRVLRLERATDGWSVVGDLRPPAPVSGSHFGAAVAADGSRLVVGAPGAPSATGPTSPGAAYTFSRAADGAWSAGVALTPSASAQRGGFGTSVDVVGTTALVGAPGVSPARGSAFVFELAPPPAEVQLVHASAAILTLGRLEVYLNQPATSTTPDAIVGFQGATAYLEVPADAPLQVRVRPVVAPPAPAPREYALTSAPLAGGTRYVVNLAGIPDELLALYAPHPTGLSQALALLARAFDAALPRSGGGIPVVVTHAVTDASALDVVVAETGQVLADDLPYGQSVTATLTPGTHRIEVRNASTGALLTAIRFTLDGTEGAFPLAITGFLNPAANQNGPALALTATDASGATVAGVNVTGTDEATAGGLELSVPNPARSAAAVRYTLPASGPVRLAVVDVLGREVAVLAEGAQAAGSHEAHLGGLAPGVYVLRMTAGAATSSRTITVVR